MNALLTVRWFASLVVATLVLVTQPIRAASPVIENSGSLKLGGLPSGESTSGLFVLISSPGTPSPLITEESYVPLSASEGCLICRGATLAGTSDAERVALGTCALVAGAVVVDGITMGDLQAGLADSRHGRTLTALFRARMMLTEDPAPKQTLILVVHGSENAVDKDAIVSDVKTLFDAVAAEQSSTASFEEKYDVFVNSIEDPNKVLSLAETASKSNTPISLSSAFAESYNRVTSSKFVSLGLDTPSTAKAFVDVGNAFAYYTRVARARVAAWKSRVSRGLMIDDFGASASELLQGVMQGYDSDTLSAAGLALVADYRIERRASLQAFVERGITDVFNGLLQNLEKKTLKRFNAALLKTLNDSPESVMNSNAATLRRETFAFEKVAENLAVPTLGLNKDRPLREFTAKLNDALLAFPDSPAAKIKRTQQTKKVVNKNKKPGQRSFDLGLDLVAVLRPDGFGSLQGFCGYQLAGNSLTFGIHNDADDPSVIAQFGGVRPPLLRVQPKLRVDVEM